MINGNFQSYNIQQSINGIKKVSFSQVMFYTLHTKVNVCFKPGDLLINVNAIKLHKEK